MTGKAKIRLFQTRTGSTGHLAIGIASNALNNINVSSAMTLSVREADENRLRPLALSVAWQTPCTHPPRHKWGRIEQAAARRDRRDLVLPSPCFKLIRARPAELSVTTGMPVSTSRKLVVLTRLSPPTILPPLLV